MDVNVYNNTTRNGINSWKVIQTSSAHLTNIFEMVNDPVFNILMVPESKIQNVISGLFSICREDTLAKFSAMVECFSLSWLMKECKKDISHQNRSRD